jgi:hypothetical protein
MAWTVQITTPGGSADCDFALDFLGFVVRQGLETVYLFAAKRFRSPNRKWETGKMGRRRVSPQEFVRVWQESEHLGEVAAKTGLSESAASCRASTYRRMKIPLKRMKHPNPVDVQRLTALAKSITPTEESGYAV